MRIIGFDGLQCVVIMRTDEWQRIVRALANMDDDDSEEN